MSTINCPDCRERVHRRANECPHCGRPSDAKVYERYLDRLRIICALLIGIDTSAVIELDVVRLQLCCQNSVASFCWIFSSAILLPNLIGVELLQRQRWNKLEFLMDVRNQSFLCRLCSIVFAVFVVGMAASAIGLVSFSFGMSWIHGTISTLTAAAGLALVRIFLTTQPRHI